MVALKTRGPALAVALALGANGCHGCGSSTATTPGGDAGAPTASASAAAPRPPSARVVRDFIEALPSCDIDHRGLLFDLGTEATVGRFGWSVGVPSGIEQVEHDGSTWARVFDRKIDLSFTLLSPSTIFVSARTFGHTSKSAAVLLDDQPLGTLKLAREQIRVATTGTTTLPVDAGMHTITIRFSGRAKNDDPFAELDWVRVGVPDEETSTYGAPTLRDAVDLAAALGDVPHRALAMRAPGEIRCPLRVPKRGRLRVALGVSGPGSAEAELRLLRDGAEPELLAQVPLEGGEKAKWKDVDLPLGRFDGDLVTLAFGVTKTARGARVLFGDPAIVVDGVEPAGVPRARAAIVVVLDGVAKQELPPWGGSADVTPELSELARTAATFDRHRAPSSVVPAVVASLVTGLAPHAHALTDPYARLPSTVTTIARIARDASVRTAMFTGVPSTTRAFGFDAGWERFVQHSPTSGDAATAPIDDATAWIGDVLRDVPDARMLAVVHARGGHPPWDVTAKELSAIKPTDYTGPIEPRGAAEAIAKLERKRSAVGLTAADRDRVAALAAIGLHGQDHAIGALVAALKTAGLWDQTLFVVTGDVSSGATSVMPYAVGRELSETALGLPLYVHFPGSARAGERIAAPTGMVDVARTIADALGLTLPKEAKGNDLAKIAAGLAEATMVPQIATFGPVYSVRLGELVLAGKEGVAPSMCDLSVDPTCAFDRRAALPLATHALFRAFVRADVARRATPDRREPATLDADTAAMLSAWGVGGD